ncbi:hypothetical protein NK8_63260 (plasmid) [Caballeronia sp. NK8]|nr:hypothetical protein NK8_63260 [Caballeronia sp. NK8]
MHRDAVDFRKSINGLAAIVEQSMKLDPFARAVYVFSNQRRDRIKMLLWDRTKRAGPCCTTQELHVGADERYPTDPTQHVSHETIYTAIYAQPRGELRRQLIACLRHGHSTRMPRTRGADRRGQIPDMVSIHVRPPEIEDRLLPGHWEGDFIKGANNASSVGVLVERTSRLVLLAKMEDATAASALAGFSTKLNSIAEPLRQSFTYDQGKEMSRHAELTAATGVKVYFCDPHSPWQRGTCENTNGLLRQYLPKGTDLSVYSQDELDAIADSLNSRRRTPARRQRQPGVRLAQAIPGRQSGCSEGR